MRSWTGCLQCSDSTTTHTMSSPVNTAELGTRKLYAIFHIYFLKAVVAIYNGVTYLDFFLLLRNAIIMTTITIVVAILQAKTTDNTAATTETRTFSDVLLV